MSAFLAFLGTFLLSLFVALLAALQLADYFAATEEFALVLMALPVFVTICLLAFIAANALARQPRVFNAVAAVPRLARLHPAGISGARHRPPPTARPIRFPWPSRTPRSRSSSSFPR